MKKLIAAVVAIAVLVITAAASCTMLVVSVSMGTVMTLCGAEDQEGGSEGQVPSLEVVGDLPAVEGYTPVQVANAAVILTVANERELGPQGARVALITAIQESGLRNLANAGGFVYPAKTTVMTHAQWTALRPIVASSVNYPNDGAAKGDWDSIGLFQGRYSISTWSGEGPPEVKIPNLLNPTFTAGRFFDALERVSGWREMRPAAAAQAVQRSAFPDAYEKHWDNSARLVDALAGIDVSGTSGGPCGAQQSSEVVSAAGWTRPITEHKALTSPYGMRSHPILGILRLHAGQDFSAPRKTPLYAASAGVVVSAGAAGPSTGGLNWVVIDHGSGVLTRYLHSDADGILVKVGEQVSTGQEIATVGMSGYTTGAHIHFEVSVNGSTIDPIPFLEERGISY